MRFLYLLCIFLAQACVATHDTQEIDTPLFPYVNTEITSEMIEAMGQSSHGITYKAPVFTQSAEQNFVYLALAEAVRTDDFPKVIEGSNELLRLNPDPQMIADASSWLLSSGYIIETQEILKKAVAVLPDDLSLHIMLSEAILLDNEANPQAFEILADYVERHPTEYVAQMELALAYLKSNNPQYAYDTFNSLPENEKNPMVLYYMGFSLNKAGDTDEAVRILKKAVHDNPDFMEAILELAQIEEERSNYSEARKYYERVLEFDVYNQDVLLHLVSIALKQGNPDRAFEIARTRSDSFSFVVGASAMLMEEGRADLVDILLTELASDDNASRELIYLQGALAYEGMQDYARALYFLDQLTPEDKHYKNSIDLKAQIFLEQNKLDDALLLLNSALLTFPNDKGIQTLIYQIYLYQSRFETAYSVLKNFTETYPDDFEAAFKLAFVEAHINKKKSALKRMQALLLIEPENHEILNFIGYSLAEEKKNLNYALELIEKADQISPNTDYILDSLAWVHYQRKEYEKAWIFIQKAIFYIKPNTPHDPSMWDHYGDIAFALNREDKARIGWEKSLQLQNDPKVKIKLNKLLKK